MSWSWWVMLGCCTYVYEHVGWSQPGHVWRRAENATDGGLWEQPSGHSEVPAESWSSRQPQGGSANTWPVGSARSVTVTLFQQPDVCSCQLLLHQPVTAATAESLCTTIFFFQSQHWYYYFYLPEKQVVSDLLFTKWGREMAKLTTHRGEDTCST